VGLSKKVNIVQIIFERRERLRDEIVREVPLTSGRVSSEILIKTVKQKVPIIASHSAPTDLAVGLAEKLNLTLIGFVRGCRMNIYTNNYRII